MPIDFANWGVRRSTFGTHVFFFAMITSLFPAVADAIEPNAAKDHAVVEALLRLPKVKLDEQPAQRQAVMRHLARIAGTSQYIEVAKRLKVYNQTEQLMAMYTKSPFSNLGVEAARLLLQGRDFDSLAKGVRSENPEAATAAAEALGFVSHPKTQKMLLDLIKEPSTNLQVRIAATKSLGRGKLGQEQLLKLVQQERIADELMFVVSDSLLGSSDRSVRQRASRIIKPFTASNSEDVPPIKELAKKRGNTQQGKLVFETVGTCAKCHKVGGAGKEVGPDLSEIGSKLSREALYVAILNPNAAVSHNYETYTLLDADDRVVSGLLMNKTDTSVTVRNAEGIDHTVASDNVVSLKKMSVSLMPADLQKSMSVQNLVDLVDYLFTLRKKGDGPFLDLAAGEIDDSHDPSKAVDGFEIADGLQVELFASEPLLLSPTSIDIDHLGRVWVCEAVNYRHFRNQQNVERSEGDRILVLEDTDADGVADKRTVFYQDPEIDSPHGVCIVGKSIFVSAGEHVFIFTDEDGDLKPDSKRVLFSGISGVQHDHGIHAFGVGPDGKLYFNFGNEGKQLKTADGETIVDKAGNVVDSSRNPYQQGMVFRCNPDGSELETLGWNFRNNWEVCVDSFGTLWQSDNDDDGNRGTRINFVMEFGNYGYRDERDGATWRVGRIGLEGTVPEQHWHLNDPGVVPNILQTGAGSPTGICFYEGSLLPEPFQNQIIHTDPGPNVVRAYPVEDDGAGYRASIRNLVKGVRDPWFRPVDVCAAPDGSLFVADWYDPGVGGHRMGDAKHGRIFRVVPKGHKGYEVPRMDLSAIEGTLEALQNANLATRFVAQEKIAEYGDAAVEGLRNLVEGGGEDRMRARALWQLGLVAKDPAEIVELAVGDASPDIRIVGIRMARQHDLDVIRLISRMKSDASVHVRRELAIALRHSKDPRAAALWVDLAMQHDGKDRWYLEALGIAADRQWDQFFQAWLNRVGDNWDTAAGRDIIWRCRSSMACSYLAEIIAKCNSVEEQYRYFRAFDFHEGDRKFEALNDLLSSAR